MASRRSRERRDKREPIPDFDQPAQPAGIFDSAARNAGARL